MKQRPRKPANSHTLFLAHTLTQITSPNPHPPADGSLAGDDVTLAVIEAKVRPQLADALTGQAVHAEVAGVADALPFPRPLVHLTLGVLVTGLEFTGVGLVTWKAFKRGVLIPSSLLSQRI